MAIAPSTCRFGLIALWVVLGMFVTGLGHSACYPEADRDRTAERQTAHSRQVEGILRTTTDRGQARDFDDFTLGNGSGLTLTRRALHL